jgi:ABC-type lipoprotein release transport system permease subunit
MIISLAWKNIWRNKKRSLIITIAISFGLWGGLFSGAIMMGMMESIVDTAINRDLSHIQIHKADYEKEKEIINYIPGGIHVLANIKKADKVIAASGRTLINGMISSPTSSFGTKIVGINPEDATKVTDINLSIYEGDYFGKKYRNQIIVGKKLTERLNLKLRSKVVLSFQNLEGEITYIACRIVGIFKTASTLFDESNVYVQHKDLFRILDTEPVFHEIAIKVENVEQIEPIAETIKSKYASLEIRTWIELAPEIAFLAETMEIYTYVFVAIILLALLFGITNTMLMSVVDRIREFGVLLAIGMKKGRVFVMIVLETILLSFTGGIIGTIISVLSIAYFAGTGMDLTAIAASLESFGASTMLYPFLPMAMYIILTIMIIIAANIAALLPAWKAMHLVPSEAIRTY